MSLTDQVLGKLLIRSGLRKEAAAELVARTSSPGASSAVVGSWADWVAHDHSVVDGVDVGHSVTVPCDGAGHVLSGYFGSPPEWLEADGTITEPGLYLAGIHIYGGTHDSRTAPPTTPGLWVYVEGAFSGDDMISLDALATNQGFVTVQDIMALGASDVPTQIANNVNMPTDATAKIDYRIFVARLAH